MRLSHRDFDTLQQTILQLYEFREHESFRAAAPQIFLKLIPAETFAWPEFKIGQQRGNVSLLECVASNSAVHQHMVNVAPRLLLNHPIAEYGILTGNLTAFKLSDFVTVRQFRDTILFQEGHRAFAVDRELVLPVRPRLGHGPAAISFCRRGLDFSERDRVMLNLLQHHFNQAHRNAQVLSTWSPRMPRPSLALTRRESEVGFWLAQGKTNTEIAMILLSKPRTIEKHVEKILEKLGVENRTAAALTLAGANGSQQPFQI